MLRSFLVWLLTVSQQLVADDLVIPAVHNPSLPARASTVRGFVPKGWKLEAQELGDLNGDGIGDAVLVLHQNNPRNIVANEIGPGLSRVNANPRLLVVVLGERRPHGYALVLQNSTLIPRLMDAITDDPFDGISIFQGTFRVSLHLWVCAGSWGSQEVTLAFRYQEGCFKLVGYEGRSVQRNTGETTDRNIDFLTKISETTTGFLDSDEHETNRQPLQVDHLQCLDEVGDGLEFQPEK